MLNVNSLTGTSFGRIRTGERKPLLTNLGLHVSDGPLCKDTKLPVQDVSGFYQHFLKIPTHTQLLFNKLLSCFKEKSLIETSQLQDLRTVIVGLYKNKESSQTENIRLAIISRYKHYCETRNRRSNPRLMQTILLKLFPKKNTSKQMSDTNKIINSQLDALENILTGFPV